MSTPAPEGVNWGTTNTPVEKRIDPNKTYKTRSGRRVFDIVIKLYNSCGREVTYPVKGSIDMGKNRMPAYGIWTLDGRGSVMPDSFHHKGVNPSNSDLIEVI
jgi:hypothetical protein